MNNQRYQYIPASDLNSTKSRFRPRTIGLILAAVLLPTFVIFSFIDENAVTTQIFTRFSSFGINTPFSVDKVERPESYHTNDEFDSLNHGMLNSDSVLTLFFPLLLMRDVVIDQPVHPTDIPFFWHVHVSDERVMKRTLVECYRLKLIELNDFDSIRKARELGKDFIDGIKRDSHVITSPHVQEVSKLLSKDRKGRMLCFYRHPLDYDRHSALPVFTRNDNWLTRYISGIHDDDVNFKELAVAKHVVRLGCTVGTPDKMKESIIRMGNYWGWEGSQGELGVEEGEEKGAGVEQCVDNILDEEGWEHDETFLDHNSEEWLEFYEKNKYDCQLYEQARSTRRAQVQTIIPYNLQLDREGS